MDEAPEQPRPRPAKRAAAPKPAADSTAERPVKRAAPRKAAAPRTPRTAVLEVVDGVRPDGAAAPTTAVDPLVPLAALPLVAPAGPAELPRIIPAEPELRADESGSTERVVLEALETMQIDEVPVPLVRQVRRPRVRRVTRVVRHVDTWSVFKVALVFSLFMYAVCLTAGVLLWQVAQNTGTVDNIERFFETFGWQTFELKGGELYHNAWVGGLFLVVGLTGLLVLAATLFNLITDLVGGIRVSVLEEEVVEREPRPRRRLSVFARGR
ncbi:MAG: DUF3566 domain-containing protein [Acidobacteria bacterium]|nr:DUF3566 domain-containing protein [Acidobacteriota bacterium]